MLTPQTGVRRPGHLPEGLLRCTAQKEAPGKNQLYTTSQGVPHVVQAEKADTGKVSSHGAWGDGWLSRYRLGAVKPCLER